MFVRAIIRASRCTLQYESLLFDGARFLTRAFYINRLSAHAVKRAPSKGISERVESRSVRDSFVHQDARYARNHEYPKALNHIPCVVLSCIKMHATWNYAWDVSVVQQNARDNMESRYAWKKHSVAQM